MTQSNILCGNCRASNRITAKFCQECGNTLKVSPLLLKQRYQILTMIGQGGFGAIYQAEDTHFPNRPKRAVKEMLMQSHDAHEQQQAIEAFKQEALLLAGLMHQNLPRIYEYFEEGGRWYLVMDYINGETLEDWMQTHAGGKLPFQRVLNFAMQLCSVLDYLHNQQPPIIFRDLKPANVMITADDHLYLIDFGIARLFKPGQAKDTMALGSPGYAAPEQYGKAQTTERADIYSLGATLHHLFSGRDPSNDPFQFPPLDLSRYAPAGPDVAKRIEQMLAMDAQKRPISVRSIKLDLQRLMDTTRFSQVPDQTSAEKSTQLPHSVSEQAPDGKSTYPLYQVPEQIPGGKSTYPIYPVQNPSIPLSVQSSSRRTADEYLDLSKELIDTGRYSEALEACTQVLRLDPKQALAHYNMGLALCNLGRFPEALDACERALRLDPSYASTYINKSWALCELGRFPEALDASNQAIRYDPQQAMAFHNASQALCELRRFPEALDACERALQLNPSYVSTYVNKSWALCELRRYPEALEACNQALMREPQRAVAHNNACVALIGLARYQEALNACNQALRLDPDNAKANQNKAFLQKKLGRY